MYREFFPRGLTALDDIDEATLGTLPSMGHVTAREEVTSLLRQLKLPRAVRERAADHLFGWPPKFALPTGAGIKNPLLSRLAFFTRYESLLRCLAPRPQGARSSPPGGRPNQRLRRRAESPEPPQEGPPEV